LVGTDLSPADGSQSINQMLFVSLVPICLSRPSRIDRQIREGDDPISAARKSLSGKVIDFNTLALSELPSCKILHACFAKSARLNNSMSLKPRPPRPFVESCHPKPPNMSFAYRLCIPTKICATNHLYVGTIRGAI
jgi:hypothetical protein